MLTLLDGVGWDGVPVPGERSHQLLAMLTLAAPRAVPVGDLVDRLWPDEEPSHPEKALQVLVSRTRSRTGPDAIVRGAAGYRLGLRDDQVDVLRVRGLVRQAREARDAGDLDVARHAARDALAVTVTGAEGPLGDLADLVLDDQDVARRLLGSALLARGDAAQALPLLEDALSHHPHDEDLVAEVLRAEAAARGVPAALERYAAHLERTLDATGAEPGEVLRRLHAELLARDAPVREGLQYDAAPMIGRDDAVADVRALLTTSRVVSMIGPGGLGKTRMAHLVGRLAQEPVVHFVELAGVTSSDGVLRKVAADLGIRDSLTLRSGQRAGAAATDLRGRLAEALSGAPTLLILDNCEHLVDAVADLVAFLVAASDRTRVLTTSRAPLGIAAEQVYPLAQLGEVDAVELFGQRARSARPGVRLDTDEVASLVRRLDGLPLAIELAAAKVRVMSVAEIARRLGDRFALLAGGDRSAPARHQTLEAVIGWSWNLLRVEDQMALRRLSVFPDGFSLAAAEHLLGRDPMPSLAELADQSLLVVSEADTVRYRFLETVREYGLKQLAEAGETDATLAALRAWAVELGRDLGGRIYTREQVAVMGLVRADVGNLAGVLRTVLDERDQPATVVLAGLLAAFWSIEGDHIAVLNLSSPVLDVLDGADPGTQDIDVDELVGTIGMMVINEAIFTGRARPAAIDQLRRAGPGQGGRASAVRTLLLAVYENSTRPQVDRLEELSEDPDPVLARAALQWMSQTLENLGEVTRARQASERALALCDGDDGPWTAALNESMLSGLANQEGDSEGCIRHARAALPVMVELGATQDIMELRAVIALSDLRVGRIDLARTALEELARYPADVAAIGWSVGTVGMAELALAEGDVDRGLELHRQCVDVERQRRFGAITVEPDLTPWVLFAESAAVFAHVVSERLEGCEDLEAKLRSECGAILDDDREDGVDFPVAGCVLLALGGYDLVAGRDAGRAVTALALANRFGYQRGLPSMAWERVEALAEAHAPGLLADAAARYVDRLPADLREEAAEALGC